MCSMRCGRRKANSTLGEQNTSDGAKPIFCPRFHQPVIMGQQARQDLGTERTRGHKRGLHLDGRSLFDTLESRRAELEADQRVDEW